MNTSSGTHAPGLTIALEFDAARWLEAVADLRRLGEDLRRRMEVRRAGRLARWQVAGGLDPAYATPEARDAQVRALLRLSDGPQMAAAFLRGWAEHH